MTVDPSAAGAIGVGWLECRNRVAQFAGDPFMAISLAMNDLRQAREQYDGAVEQGKQRMIHEHGHANVQITRDAADEFYVAATHAVLAAQALRQVAETIAESLDTK
jgi:hypothetical protein